MNRHIHRVFFAYLIALLFAVILVPWFGQPVGFPAPAVTLYAPFWSRPAFPGFFFLIDLGRLFLEMVSLTLVLLAAVVSLWGREGKGPPTGERREPEGSRRRRRQEQ